MIVRILLPPQRVLPASHAWLSNFVCRVPFLLIKICTLQRRCYHGNNATEGERPELHKMVTDQGKAQLPTTKEVLTEHLYALVRELEPNYADRLTGMLADCSNEEMLNMLEDSTFLKYRLQKALITLNSHFASLKGMGSHNDVKPLDKRKEELGEKLFEQVALIESELCAQITGMLLELDESTLDQFIHKPDQLKAAVAKAKSEYLLQIHPDTVCSQQDLGDQLYQAVLHYCPDQAAKVTGMLLELKQSVIQELLWNPAELQKKVQCALDVLKTTNS